MTVRTKEPRSRSKTKGDVSFPVKGMSDASLFITGMPRSGTTLVSMMLNAHSQISISPETHYFEKYLRKGERRGCLIDDRRFSDFAWFFLRGKDVKSFNFSEEDLQLLHRRIMERGERSHKTILQAVLELWAHREGKTICGEKTPKHMHYIEQIRDIFPDARFVHVIRDPRDVILSLRKVDWEPGNLLQHLKEWKKSADYALKYSRQMPDRFLVVRYEDVLNDPVAAARRMCAFLDVPFEETMLTYHEHTTANFNVETEPWKAKNLSAIDPANQMKWKRQMPERECTIIEASAGDAIEQLGYPLLGNKMDAGTRLEWERLRIENRFMLGVHLFRCAWLRYKNSY